MKLKMVRHLWGVEKNWTEAFGLFRQMGYEWIESPMPAGNQEHQFTELMRENDLGYVAMAFTSGNDPQAHLESFRSQLQNAIRLGASLLTAHSGRDSWDPETSLAFYKEVVQIEKDSPIPVAHETHRGRVFFNPWITRVILDRLESLKLCCDFSHWVCVAERLNWDDEKSTILHLVARHAVHLHARVGYEQGPQVPDPSAAEYRHHLQTHMKWWEIVWKSQQARGLTFCTVTPEFGPPAYLHTLPHTNVPVANLWDVCEWMAGQIRERYATTINPGS